LLRTPPFLATILRRPQLAQYVKTLAFNADYFYKYPKVVIDSFNGIQHEIKAGLSRICGDDDDEVREWYNNLHHSPDAITALVIIFLPNLSTLNLPYYPGIDNPLYPEYTPRVLSQASRPPTYDVPRPFRLDQLRNLDVGASSLGLCSWTFVEPLLQLRSLRCLRCSGLSLEDKDISSIEKTISHITHFELELSRISPAALIQLLKSCPNLSHFSYLYHKGPDDEAFGPATIRDGLMHLKDSLQELMLFNPDEEDGNFNMLWPLGSLAGFRKLQRLRASMRTLVGHEPAQATPGTFENGNGESSSGTLQPLREQAISFVESLPESLQELAIQNCEDTVYTVLGVLFESIRKGKLQNLTTMRLPRRIGMKIETKEAIRCAEEGKALGICVRYIL